MNYEVYVCYVDDVLSYVGSGRIGRHKHCDSGCSHVYELNASHFNGCKVEVIVTDLFESKQESLDVEKYYIEECKPKLNTQHNSNTYQIIKTYARGRIKNLNENRST